MEREQEVPQSPPPKLGIWGGLWIHHLTSILASGAMLLAAGGFLYSSLQFDTRENLVQMKGRLASLNIIRGATDEENSFQFTVQEYADVFRVKNLKIADQLLLANLERPGNELRFAVSREEYQQRNGSPVRVYELSSDENVYLVADDTGSLMAKARYLGFTLAALCLFGILRTGMILRRRARLFADPEFDRGEVDAFLLMAVNWLSAHWPPKLEKWRPQWLLAAVEIERARRAAVPERPKTDAPKAVKAVRILLKQPHRINAHGENGKTPLHLSVEGGHVEAVELLLKNGADPELADSEGNTSLLLAVKGKSMGVLMKLIDARAKVQVTNTAGETPMALAAKHKIKGILPLVQKALEREKAAEAKAAEAAAAAAAATGSVTDPGDHLVKAVVPASDGGNSDDDSGDGFGKVQ